MESVDNEAGQKVAFAMHNAVSVSTGAQKFAARGGILNTPFEKSCVDGFFGISSKEPKRDERMGMIKAISDRNPIPFAYERNDGTGLDVFWMVQQFVAECPEMTPQKAEFLFIANSNARISQGRITNVLC